MSDAPDPPLETKARYRAFLMAWAGICLFLLLQNTINALSEQRDRPHLRPIEPFVWEYSSALLAMALVPGIAWLLRLAPPARGRWLRFVLAHLAGSVAFCALHVGGFVAIRKAIYALAGAHYGGADWLYEYRKDALTYFGFGLIFWLADWAARQWAASRAPAPQSGQRLYHLRDGARVVRVPLDEIVAVTSARNYVEFHLAGGRKPLVRDTLAKVEEELAAAGFLRTHRSWLVNPAHVRAITPAAAGDFRLELDGGVTAPLSRRFPEALETLRTPEGPEA
ncbi:MAG TPA: LytTR family DNA-binding domain-containing protein [Phenylobacterium sp.]|nr:LytTR family DNA-binding domain-containing protein [Phenylobacterium sp.]